MSVHLSTVRLAIGGGLVACGYGIAGRLRRRIPFAEVASARVEDLDWPAVYGIGQSLAARATRMTVRPGPTLVLGLRSGEPVRISTVAPAVVAGLINEEVK